MTNDFPADVLICGAGAAGLTLAIELARRGVSFRLIEKMEVPFPGSRGKEIQPRTQEIFEDFGILDRIVAAGGIYPPLRVYHDDGSYSETKPIEYINPTPAEPYHIPLMIPQFLTETILRERLAEMGHKVEFGLELSRFEQSTDGVVARVGSANSEESLQARFLVSADGGRSFVRGALGINFPGKTLGARGSGRCDADRIKSRCLASVQSRRHRENGTCLPASRNRSFPNPGTYFVGGRL